MDEDLCSRTSELEQRVKQFNTRIESFALERDGLFQEEQLRLFIGSVDSLDAFLNLSCTLEDVYSNVLGRKLAGSTTANAAQELSAADCDRVSRKIQDVIASLAAMDSSAELSLRDAMSLALGLKHFYNSDILSLGRHVNKEMEIVNSQLLRVKGEIATGNEKIESMEAKLDALTANIETSLQQFGFNLEDKLEGHESKMSEA
jgi:hypothetical protein